MTELCNAVSLLSQYTIIVIAGVAKVDMNCQYVIYLRNQWCLFLFTWQTDPENTDYVCENGATRNFQAQKLLEDEENRRQKEEEEEQQNNPMKVKTLLDSTEACSSHTLNAICLPHKGNHHL